MITLALNHLCVAVPAQPYPDHPGQCSARLDTCHSTRAEDNAASRGKRSKPRTTQQGCIAAPVGPLVVVPKHRRVDHIQLGVQLLRPGQRRRACPTPRGRNRPVSAVYTRTARRHTAAPPQRSLRSVSLLARSWPTSSASVRYVCTSFGMLYAIRILNLGRGGVADPQPEAEPEAKRGTYVCTLSLSQSENSYRKGGCGGSPAS